MKKLAYLTLIGCLFVLTACKKDKATEAETEYFIFGENYGLCGGDCAFLYKLEDGKLYADEVDRLFNDTNTLTFADEPLAPASYTLGVALQESLPDQLVDNPEDTYGCPDCADQGLIYLEWKTGSNIYKRYLDNAEEELPDWLAEYVQDIKAVLDQLN